MSLLSFIVKKAVPAPKIESFERYLFIGPHPDDIEIGAGSAAARLVQEGKKVSFLICTDGRYGDGHTEFRGDALAAFREKEALASAAKLGVTDVHFLRLSDGAFYTEDELRRGMAEVIGRLQPEILFCPDPDVPSECHRDHLNAGRMGKEMALFASVPGIMEKLGSKAAPVQALALYMTAKPNRFIRLKGCGKLQDEAIFGCHQSQFPKGSADASSLTLYLKLRRIFMGLRCLSTAAEGFRVLSLTAMHCLPEEGK